MHPSNFELTLVGDTVKTLRTALELMHDGDECRLDGHVILPSKEVQVERVNENGETFDILAVTRLPALAFYRGPKPEKRKDYAAKKMTKPASIALFIASWLEELENSDFGPSYHGTTSSRGWRLNAGYAVGGAGEAYYGQTLVALSDVYPDIDFATFQFMVRPEWVFYAK